MYKFLLMLFVMVFAGLSVASEAEARKRSLSFGGRSKSTSMPVIIPIPGGGSSVVFVKDLPDVPAFKFEDKGHFDLGYKFGMFGGGEWVGYFKKHSGYLELNQDKVVALILPLVGLTAADAPKQSAAGQIKTGFLWLGVLAAGFGFLMLRVPAFRKAIFALRGGRDDDEVEMPTYGRRYAEYGAPADAPQPRPSMMAAANRAAMPAAGFGRAAPAGGFGKRR